VRKLWRKRWFRIATYCLGTIAVLMVGTCWFFRIRKPADLVAYYAMHREDFHPVWRDFAFRRIGFGDTVESLRNEQPPVSGESFGGYTCLDYVDCPPGALPFTHLYILARGGRLVYAVAGSCTWQYRFFGDEEHYDAYSTARSNWVKKKLKQERPDEYRKVYGND